MVRMSPLRRTKSQRRTIAPRTGRGKRHPHPHRGCVPPRTGLISPRTAWMQGMAAVIAIVALVEFAGGLLLLAAPFASSAQVEFFAFACLALLTFGLTEVLEAAIEWHRRI